MIYVVSIFMCICIVIAIAYAIEEVSEVSDFKNIRK